MQGIILQLLAVVTIYGGTSLYLTDFSDIGGTLKSHNIVTNIAKSVTNHSLWKSGNYIYAWIGDTIYKYDYTTQELVKQVTAFSSFCLSFIGETENTLIVAYIADSKNNQAGVVSTNVTSYTNSGHSFIYYVDKDNLSILGSQQIPLRINQLLKLTDDTITLSSDYLTRYTLDLKYK